MISDGAGGYFITWMKNIQSVYGGEIYAQRIGPNGTKLWIDTGVVICNAVLNQYWPKIVSDGAGGAIIVWQDNRAGFSNWDIYAQRVDANGTRLWTPNGVPVFNGNMDDLGPDIVSDGNGGVIVASWGANSDIYAQRLNASGTRMWASSGVVICNAPNKQSVPKIASDGSGGAIICWWDFRNSPTNNVPDVYAQRIDGNANILWTSNGVPVCAMPYDQMDVQISSDNNHGAYIVWSDFRNSTPTSSMLDIYAQHLNPSGAPLWAVNGISVCSATNNQITPNLVTDENGGVIIAWHDSRIVLSSIFAQRLSANGTALWTTDGVSVCANANNYIASPFLATDGNNGVFVVWEDKRTGADRNIYAQHLNAGGSPVWTTNGVPVCNAPNDQLINLPNGQLVNGAILKDGAGVAVIAWQDGRTNTPQNSYDDIYISKISDIPASPIILNVSDKCISASTAKGKLANPSSLADIAITQDGLPLNYLPADSSFEYFISGITAAGNHTVRAKYSNFAGAVQKDSVYTVIATLTPAIAISGTTTVNQGQATTITASFSNGGSGPAFQWQDSLTVAGWTVIPGAVSSTIVYTPAQSGNKIRCILTSNAVCVTQATITSNVLLFTVNPVTAIDPVPSNEFGIRYYPNPVRDMLTIDSLKFSDKWVSLDLFASDGRQVMLSKNITGLSRVLISIPRLPAGHYIMVLRRKQGAPVFLKFIKQ